MSVQYPVIDLPDQTWPYTDREASEGVATFSYLNSGGEQTIFTISTSTRKKVHGIFLDLNTLAEDTTIRVKVKIDGTNFRTIEPLAWVQGVDDVGVYFPGYFAINQDLQVTMQEGADEGTDRAIPYSYILEELE